MEHQNKKNGIQITSFLHKVSQLLNTHQTNQQEQQVVQFHHPDDLQKLLAMSLDDAEESSNDEDLLRICKDVIKYSVKTGHRHFYNQLFGGVDEYSLAGAWITESLNTSQYTYEVGPVFTIAELSVVQKSCKLFGLEPSSSDGLFCPGGSMANMMAMHLARYHRLPEVKTGGIYAASKPFVIFTSSDSHYSIQKGAHWMGFGTENVIPVKTDERGRMIPDELKKKISECLEKGGEPLIVNATAGTTVLGAFDPFEEIADICAEYNIWMHIDACWGGSLAFSDKHKSILSGLDRADSISWNPHKMMGVPLQCSMFLTTHKGLLHHCNSANANYLFQQDKFYDVSYDTGDKTIQCGRKVDAFKLWLMWKARGDLGLQSLVDSAMEASQDLVKIIKNKPGFELIDENPQCTNVCFWFIPLSMRNKTRDEKWWNYLHQVAPMIKEKMVKEGTMMIGYTPLAHKGLKNFFRVVFTCHPQIRRQDLIFVVDQIEEYGKDISF